MELENKTVTDLRLIAKELGIDNVSKLKKSELIEVITSGTTDISTKKDDDIIHNPISVIENDNSQRYNLTTENDQYVEGILELLPDGYGFLRGDNYLSTPKDVYVSPVQIKRFRLDTGDRVKGI